LKKVYYCLHLEIGILNKDISELKKKFEEKKNLLINNIEDLNDLESNLADLVGNDYKRKQLKKSNPNMIEETSDEEND
jgi:hypothetical protein